MNSTIFKGVPSANTAAVMVMNRQKNCFLCDARLQSAHIRDIDQLFYDPKTTTINADRSKLPLATILSDVLEQTIQETAVHSKVVCHKCQQQCRQYEMLTVQLQKIRENMQNNYNETANKFSLKDLHVDLVEQGYETIEAINDECGGVGVDVGVVGDDDNNMPTISNMYTIESIDPNIGEVFENTDNIISNGNLIAKSTAQMKKVMLIKTAKNGSNPFFAISHMDESIDDDQTIHAVR